MEIHPDPMRKHSIQSRLVLPNLLYIILFLAAFLERTVIDLGPNIELLTTSMILSAFFLGRKRSFWLTLLVIVSTDRLLGNSNIILFTWSGFLIPALFTSPLIKKYVHGNKFSILNSLKIVFAGIFTNIFFYIWSNFGVWMLDSWGLYTKNLQGLVMCYINALPFLKNQMISTLIFIPAGIVGIKHIPILYKNYLLNVSQKLRSDRHTSKLRV